MRIVFFGSGEFGIPLLRNLAQNHEIVRVITQPDRPAGRGRHLTPTPIRSKSHELGLEVATVEQVNDPDVVRSILELNARLAVVVAFGQKIGDELLREIPGGCINAHASLLPKYRGAAPIHWALIRGEDTTGVSVFRMTRRMDAGPILSQRWTAIKPDETAEELHDRLAGIAVDAVSDAIRQFAGAAIPAGEPQVESQVTLAPKLDPKLGHVDFAGSASELANLINGLWSWPGARCQFWNLGAQKGEEVILARARLAESPARQTPLTQGELDERMLVVTGDGMLEILEIKPAGRNLMTWQEFVNGRHVRAGAHFRRILS